MKKILGPSLGVVIIVRSTSLFADSVMFLRNTTVEKISSAARRTVESAIDDPTRISSIEQWCFGNTTFYRVFLCDEQCSEIRLGKDGRILKTLQVYKKS